MREMRASYIFLFLSVCTEALYLQDIVKPIIMIITENKAKTFYIRINSKRASWREI
jgi:hypothetical protein